MKHYIFTLLVLLYLNLSAQNAYLGIYVVTPNSKELKEVNLNFGVKIESVMPGSPADINGLSQGDIIFKIDSFNIRNEIDLQKFMSLVDINNIITVYFANHIGTMNKEVSLANRKDLHKELYIYSYIQNPWLFIGINVEPISSSLAKLLNLETGMVILDIRDKSIAEVQGLEPGDIIISINHVATFNEKTLTDALNLGLQNQPMEFFIWRNSENFTKDIDLSNRVTDNNTDNNEVFIVGPDVFDSELYSYSREQINKLLNKSKSELEADIERLETEIFKLRQKIEKSR